MDASSASSTELVNEGRTAFRAENYVVSERVFLQALSAGADEADCRLHLARIYNHLKDWNKALEHWQWLRSHKPGTLEPELQVARALFRLKRYAEALDRFKVVLTMAPAHAEAEQRVHEIEGMRDDEGALQTPRKVRPLAAASMAEARTAFKAGDHQQSEALFLRALEEGGDEPVCRLHLARIYNLERDWPRAVQQWTWLRDHDPAKVEPHLQVARGQFQLKRYDDAAAAFKEVLKRQAGHTEAQASLRRIAVIQEPETFGDDLADADSWMSLVPTETRWELSTDVLGAGCEAIEALIDRAHRQTSALAELIGAYGASDGELSGRRQLYASQSAARLDELTDQLRSAKRTMRSIASRTQRMLEAFGELSGRKLPATPSVKQPLPRAAWRDLLVKTALDIHRAHGLKLALSWLFREALVEDRASVFADLATALRETDRRAAVRLFWLSYGTNPTPAMAERTASKMFQAGDLANAGALVKAAPVATASPFVVEMRSSASIFRTGIEIPDPPEAGVAGKRTAYVASGSLPYQVAGYTIRTHQLVTGLVRAGVDCLCFTRPGFPWDRPRAMASGLPVPSRQAVGEVTYVHSPLPDSAHSHPERTVEEASAVLERQFRSHGIGLVQAASNSRNALPALLAARRVGAKFIYEVRGLWELTAASRFAGWEETERYKLDRGLEVLVASKADHVLTITRGVAEELIKDGVSPERLSLLPNAVDPEAFKPLPKNRPLMNRLGLTDEDFTSVYAGSLTNYEGLDDLIVAVSLLRRDGMQARLVIAGDGAARAGLESLAADRGLTGAVTFVGRVRPDEIGDYLSVADVAPIPRKPFKVCMVVSPLKPFEAMSMEKAVVLSDLPALREIVADGVTGLICKPADPGDLAMVLGRLGSDPALRDRLGRAAREWVVTHRSWAENAIRLKHLYRGLDGTLVEAADDSEAAWDTNHLFRPRGDSSRRLPEAESRLA